MSVAQVIAYPDDRLRQISRPYGFGQDHDRALKQLVLTMRETMYDGLGWGLSAIQVGVPLSLFIVHVPGETINPLVFVNAEIVSESPERVELNEGCMSFKGVFTPVTRAKRVIMRRYSEYGRLDEAEFEGWTARAILHEMDHLQGRLLIDQLLPIARKALDRQLRLKSSRKERKRLERLAANDDSDIVTT